MAEWVSIAEGKPGKWVTWRQQVTDLNTPPKNTFFFLAFWNIEKRFDDSTTSKSTAWKSVTNITAAGITSSYYDWGKMMTDWFEY